MKRNVEPSPGSLTTYDPASFVGIVEAEGLDVSIYADYEGTLADFEAEMDVYAAAAGNRSNERR